MSSHSPYHVSESAAVKWRPGEKLAASGLVALVFFLVVDTNIAIHRAFRKRQGLYYYSMLIGTLGCAIDATGIIVKYFLPPATSRSSHVWPVALLCLLGGWSLYAPAQLLVLYSRLHLVNRSQKVQRWILFMVIMVIVATIVPSWIVDWPAFDTTPGVSSQWSPREAIVDRYTQPAFTCAEFVISSIYMWSLVRLLNLKTSVRQRRVMWDLIYVYIAVICLDVLAISFVFLNQPGISHPCQVFSYILKFKLEFIVLNQLMAVAARGLRKGTYEERRYHHPSLGGGDSINNGHLIWLKTSPLSPEHRPLTHRLDSFPLATPSTEVTLPSPTFIKRGTTHGETTTRCYFSEAKDSPNETYNAQPASADMKNYPKPRDTPTRPPYSPSSSSTLTEKVPRIQYHEDSRARPLSSPLMSPRSHENHNSVDEDAQPLTTKKTEKRQTLGKFTKHKSQRSAEEDSDDEIGVHMWENRGKSVLEVPWFKREAGV